MSAILSPSGVATRVSSYEGFLGLDTSRDRVALDTGSEQHLIALDNGFCDWRGQITRDPSASKRNTDNYPVEHVRHFNKDKLTWVERRGGGLAFNTDDGHSAEDIYPLNSFVSSTIFNKKVIITSQGQPTYCYDGTRWERVQSPHLDQLRPAFMAPVQRRLCVAGINGQETRIYISRVDKETIFPNDEEQGSSNVLRAGYLDVANLLGTGDELTGLASWEQDRLVCFTHDRALVYKLSPNIDHWALDDNANINVGCVSHNTIVRANTDLLFCGRDGVHSIRRSIDNGILIYTVPMSTKIDQLYRELFRSVDDTRLISACWNSDLNQYHIYFPQPGGIISRRLTLTINRSVEITEPAATKWSSGTFLNTRCADFLSGSMGVGTSGGVYDIGAIEETRATAPQMTLLTPILWHGEINAMKDTYSLILQAYGTGTLHFEAYNEDGTRFATRTIQITDDPDDNTFPDMPLSRQYEWPFQHRYRGVQFKFTTEGSGLLRIIGFAVTIKKE